MAKLQMKSGFTRKLKLPLILTLAHSVMKQLGLAEYINDNVSWDPDHWDVSPGIWRSFLFYPHLQTYGYL